MKLHARQTARRDLAIRITAPEFRTDPPKERGGKPQRIPLLSYGDESSNHQRVPCTKAIFLAAAGSNEVGEAPDGMDRLTDHQFIVHFDDNNQAIGIDVIPARLYRSKVIPKSQVDVKTLKLSWSDTGVVRVEQRPYNLKADLVRKLIEAMDTFAETGKPIKIGQTFLRGGAAKVVGLDGGLIEIKLNGGSRSGEQVYKEKGSEEDD